MESGPRQPAGCTCRTGGMWGVRHEHLPDGRILAESAFGSWWYNPETGVVEIDSLADPPGADEYLDATGLPDAELLRPEAEIVRSLTLGEYRELLAGVPEPSREQIEAFARFVSTAHSWYKHLPLLPPGVPMTLFLDPGAGAQLIVDKRGRIRQVKRRKHGFHYSWLRTAEYRDRFGHAAFARGAGTGTVVSLMRAEGSQLIPSDDRLAIFHPGRGELLALPDEVLEAGVAQVSGVVHPRAALPALWGFSTNLDASRVDWPPESGGATALAQILERVRALTADPNLIERVDVHLDRPAERHGATVVAQILERVRALSAGPMQSKPLLDPDRLHLGFDCDLVLYRLLTPERERQHVGMVAALERVVDLVR